MNFRNFHIVSALLFLTAACAHEPAVQEIAATAIPSEEISKFESQMSQAQSDQLDVLAPDNYAKASESLAEAQEGLKDKDDTKDILRKLALGQAYLGKAREFSKLSTDNMREVVEARKLALKHGAKEAFESEFKEADKELKNVTEDIEVNKTESAVKNRTAILAKYLDLEVRAIRRTALNEVSGKINQAKKDGAEDWAPQSLTAAEKSLQDAENYITANRHEVAKIKEISDKAMAAADKLILINKEAHNGTKDTGETAALKLLTERERNAVQTNELASARSKLNQAEAKDSASAAALNSEQAFNNEFEKAQAMFTKSEADVYRQGENLVIRLKGLEFDSATSTLKGSNFPLLAKVKNVIGNMNANSVEIEGHTDSVGSKLKNDQLSEARAAAVKSYFESNAANGESIQYTSTGYGFQKPIAVNKTEGGRAQNRRVDIVIHSQAR